MEQVYFTLDGSREDQVLVPKETELQHIPTSLTLSGKTPNILETREKDNRANTYLIYQVC